VKCTQICPEISSFIKIRQAGWVPYMESPSTFMIISHWILLRTRTVSDTSHRENMDTSFTFNNFSFFQKSCRLRIMWKKKWYGARQATANNITWRMRTACWLPKATYPQSEYVILIAFTRQVWLCKRAAILRWHVLYCMCCWTSLQILHVLLVCPVNESMSFVISNYIFNFPTKWTSAIEYLY